MEYNETLVDETENTEETVEETLADETESKQNGKFYTDEEFNEKVNEFVNRRVAQKMRKYEREMAKYKDTENVLKSQIGGENIEEVNRNLRDLYVRDGVQLPDEYQYHDERDIERLGIGDAEDFIALGYDAMEEEANRLASIGYKNLDKREQIAFTTLVEKLNVMKDEKELLSLGASKDLLSDKDFISFRSKFRENVPIKDIYEEFSSKQGESKVNSAGSLKNGSGNTEKTYYTDEEIARLTYEDLSDEKVWEAVRRSQTSRRK